ncbi:MAG: hypothetical protein K2H87_07060, partial [Duncaniella sp.]|nr:hypothetical protein [Duncaniella sp.]
MAGRSVTTPDSVYTLGPTAVLLDASAPEDNPAEYIYKDATAAFKAVERAGSGTLIVAPGVYWLDNPDDPEVRVPRKGEGIPYAIELDMDALTVTATNDDPELTVFAANRGQTQGAMGNFTMVHFAGKSLTLKNVTFGNYCNVDLIYPGRPDLSRPRRKEPIVQAQVGICVGTDRLFAENCRFISRLNLCPFVGARRSLYDRCYFECTDDALSGSGVYYRCTFSFFSTKPFYNTSRTGAVFIDCDIASLSQSQQHLTKMPGAVTMVDTRFTTPGRDETRAPLWSRDPGSVVCYQSGVTLNGRPITIDPERPDMWVGLDGTRLMDAYKVTLPSGEVIYNVYNLLAGDDGWDPLGQRPAIERAEKMLGRRLTGLPVTLAFDRQSYRLAAEGDTVTTRVTQLLWGGYAVDGATGYNREFPNFVSMDGWRMSGANRWPEEARGYMTATSPNGLRARAEIIVGPYLRPAPTFASAPEITADKAGRKLTIASRLAGGEEDDRTLVVWMRGQSPDGSDAVAVCQGRVSTHRDYTITRADKGAYISAILYPEAYGTERGEAVTAVYPKQIGTRHLGTLTGEQKRLSTDFSEIHVAHQPRLLPGIWTLDAFKPADTSRQEWEPQPENAWYYGHGADAAADAVGLVQATKGARLFYTPDRRECRSMRLAWDLCPAKPVGQGFGSATDQYMDLYIAFDPATLSGYALRIQRTPDYDRAVTFTPVRLDRGEATPLAEPVASSCFRTPCHIELAIEDGILTATATTSAPAVTSADPTVHPSVQI